MTPLIWNKPFRQLRASQKNHIQIHFCPRLPKNGGCVPEERDGSSKPAADCFLWFSRRWSRCGTDLQTCCSGLNFILPQSTCGPPAAYSQVCWWWLTSVLGHFKVAADWIFPLQSWRMPEGRYSLGTTWTTSWKESFDILWKACLESFVQTEPLPFL